MYKYYALLSYVWLKKLKLPLVFDKRYIFHHPDGTYPFKDKIQDFIQNNSGMGIDLIIEVKKKSLKRDDYSENLTKLRNILSVIRIVKHNRIFLRHFVCVEDNVISRWNSDYEPPRFAGKDEAVSYRTLKESNRVIYILKKILNRKLNMRLPLAIYFWNSSLCSNKEEERIINLFIALEALFTTDKSEVTYKLANRIAWFMGTGLKSRRKVFDQIVKGYDIRSDIVHGSFSNKSIDLSLIEKIHSLTRDIILKILRNSRITRVFTYKDKKVFSEYLKGLVIGKRSFY